MENHRDEYQELLHGVLAELGGRLGRFRVYLKVRCAPHCPLQRRHRCASAIKRHAARHPRSLSPVLLWDVRFLSGQTKARLSRPNCV